MNILITGSNGFIGSHTAAYLRQQGNYVIGLGRRETSACPVDAYVCCDMDSDRVAALYDLIQAAYVDAVVHLAADMRKEPYGIEVVSHNCVGTQRILELCREKGIRTFVQLSSLPVIGKPSVHPITEEHPLAPPTVYHVTKVTEELLAGYADAKHGIRTVSFRISAPVGLRMNPNTIFPVFIKNALQGTDLVLSGKGTRQQAYVHVADIARAVELALIKEHAHGIYNLSSQNLISNKDLAKKCVRLLHSKSGIVFSGEEDAMDEDVWDVSLEKIQRDLGYQAQVSMDEAILEYADGLRQPFV